MDIILDKILYMNIAAIGLIPAVILVRAAFHKAPKYIRCILWALVAIRLVCPFSIETAFSLVPSIDSIQQHVNENDYVGQDSQIIEDEQVDDSNVEIIEDSEEQLSAELEEHSVDNESFEEIPDNTEYIDNADIVSINIYSIIWIFGMATILLHSIISYFRLKKRVSTATYYDDRIWVSDAVETPFILGVLRPRIYLPSGMDGEIKKYVLAHEYAHISRRDYIWKPLGFLIVCVHWFNPLVWVSYVLFSRDIEMACDEKVIKNYDVEERKAYSKALLACSASNRATTECPVAFSEVGVKGRVKSVINYKKTAFWIIIIALIACITLAVGFMTEPKGKDSEVKSESYESQDEAVVKEYLATNNIGISEVDKENIISLCQDAFTEYVNACRDKELADFSPYIRGETLQTWMQFRIDYYSYGYSRDKEYKVFVEDVQLYEDYALLSGVTGDVAESRKEGMNYFLVENIDGKLLIVDWYWDSKDTPDVLFRGKFDDEQLGYWKQVEKIKAKSSSSAVDVEVFNKALGINDKLNKTDELLLYILFMNGWTKGLLLEDLRCDFRFEMYNEYNYSSESGVFINEEMNESLSLTKEQRIAFNLFLKRKELYENNQTNFDSSITMTVEDVTPTGAKIVFNRKNDDLPEYPPDGWINTGDYFWLEEYRDGQWIELELKEIESDSELARLGPFIVKSSDREMDVNWESRCGSLPTGKYRIRKELGIELGWDYFVKDIYAEFEIK